MISLPRLLPRPLTFSLVLFYLVGILLLLSVVAMAEDGPEDLIDLPKMSLTLKKGWNMVPAFGGGTGYGGSCMENDFPITYILNPLNKKYFLMGPYSETEEYKQLAEQGYYAAYFAGIWIYVPEDCDLWMGDMLGPSNFKMAQGWQFVAKRKLTTSFSVFKDCSIEKFNQWDNEAKTWAYTPSASGVDLQNVFDQAGFGEVFAMKFSAECMLDEMEIAANVLPQPPALE